SFGQWQSSLQGGYTSKGLQLSVRGLYDYAENDFEYYNRAYDRIENRNHNRHERYNVMASEGQKTGTRKWKSVLWIDRRDNQIPGNILNTSSRTRQEDPSLRWLSTNQTGWGDADISFKNYLGRIELNYLDPEADTRSLNPNRRWMVSSNL